MTDAESKQILQLVKEELCKILNRKTIDDFEEIVPLTVAEELLIEENLFVYTEFKDQLKSPWAIAKYIALCAEEKELIEKVKADLNNIIPDTVDEFFVKHLSCNIQFVKKYIEGAKKQVLTVNYFLDEDDKLQYKLLSNSVGGWDISKVQLQALLKNEGFLSEKFNEPSKFKKILAKLKFWRH